MEQAEALLSEHRAREATPAIQAASATLTQLTQAIERFQSLKQGLLEGRTAAEQLLARGYRVETSSQALDSLEQLLAEAVAALQQGGPPEAEDELERATAALERATTYGSRLPEIQATNTERLQATEQAGKDLAALIAQGRTTFDIVDEFAESTWSDIRGNGSEAQAAADRAHGLWQRAGQRNTMEAQEFVAAQQDLDAADKEIAAARQLITTIMTRLKDLEQARDHAKDEIAAAEADIASGWAFVRANDPDVGKQPEAMLTQAEQLLKQAQQELARPKPNWLALVKQAQDANAAADAALVGARDEVTAMQKLREQLERGRQLATAEVQKVVTFATTHKGDLKPATERAISGLQTQVQQAFEAFKQVDKAQEEARARLLQQALELYRRLHDSADKAYQSAEGDFQRAEALRQRGAEIVQPAREALERAQRSYEQYGHLVSRRAGVQELLQRAQAALDGIGAIADEDDLRRASQAAAQAKNDADEAEDALQKAYRRYQRDHQGPNFPSGPIIIGGGWGGGSGGSSSGSGGNWGGFGGGGGGSWGGGGGGGGSWGGGGGGGGGW